MDRTIITADTALDLLSRAVSERGEDFVMRDECVYFRHGVPACGVGLALSYVGVTAADIGETDNYRTVGVIADRIDGVEITDEAVNVFQTFQSHQDSPSTWGYSLERAKQKMEAR